MDESDVKKLALITASYARIEGMKSANYLRRLNDESPAYSEDHFESIANDLEELATDTEMKCFNLVEFFI